jgi:hypothetical protein
MGLARVSPVPERERRPGRIQNQASVVEAAPYRDAVQRHRHARTGRVIQVFETQQVAVCLVTADAQGSPATLPVMRWW